MKILIETIPHKKQRYPTCGDWQVSYPKGQDLQVAIQVSEEVGDWRAQALVAVHELIEVLQCQKEGITQNAVDVFDNRFEKDRDEGKHSKDAEPGDDTNAPYYKQHQIATGVERILAAELGVDWNTYADAIERLP